jgi:hypothetical protein
MIHGHPFHPDVDDPRCDPDRRFRGVPRPPGMSLLLMGVGNATDAGLPSNTFLLIQGGGLQLIGGGFLLLINH